MSSVKRMTEVRISNDCIEVEKTKKFSKLSVGDFFAMVDPDKIQDLNLYVKTSDDDDDGDINAFRISAENGDCGEEVSIAEEDKIYPISFVSISIQ